MFRISWLSFHVHCNFESIKKLKLKRNVINLKAAIFNVASLWKLSLAVVLISFFLSFFLFFIFIFYFYFFLPFSTIYTLARNSWFRRFEIVFPTCFICAVICCQNACGVCPRELLVLLFRVLGCLPSGWWFSLCLCLCLSASLCPSLSLSDLFSNSIH